MSLALVDSMWGDALTRCARDYPGSVEIISPFIKRSALEGLIQHARGQIRVITRFNLDDFAAGVSDLSALELLLHRGARVRGIRGLHSKVYLFGARCAAVTSANLTGAAFQRNAEFGIVTDDAGSVATCQSYFDGLWSTGNVDLAPAQLRAWHQVVTAYLATSPPHGRRAGLGDHGAAPDPIPSWPMDSSSLAVPEQAYVKFLGSSNSRVPLGYEVMEEIRRSGCNRFLSYPTSRRPKSVKEGAEMFIARLVSSADGSDIRVFGRANALRYEPVRDDVTPADIAARPWRSDYSRFVRVYDSEFVAGRLVNGISLADLMDALKARAFAPTLRNQEWNFNNPDGARKNENPRAAYMRAPHIELSCEGRQWLRDQLQAAMDRHGRVPSCELDDVF